MPLDQKRLADLLLEAFAYPEEERRAFVDKACAADAQLRDEALAYLAVEERLGDFLEQPAAAAILGEDEPEQTFVARPIVGGDSTGSQRRASALQTPAADLASDATPAPRQQRHGPHGKERLGAYRIVGPVGAGGMGQVYIGEDERLGRRVAVKTLPPEMLEEPGFLERFEREAQVLATLSHPNIVTIHTVEEEDGTPFLTMELIEGQTLGEVIVQGVSTLEEFLDIAIQLASALAAAHARGVIHRDLKPANVMITADGRVKVLDFGIAKFSSRQDLPALSYEGMVIGTVSYMSPEQVRGEPADARSDLFALGIVLYEMATGTHPFPAEGALKRAAAIIKDEPRPAHERRPDVDVETSDIIARCLQKDPQQRYQTAGELCDALECLRDTHLAAKLLAIRHPETPPRRHLRSGWMVFAIAMAVLVAMMAANIYRGRSIAGTPVMVANADEIARTTVAVLPFQNLTAEPRVAWLASGIPELLVTDLAQSPELQILGTGEVRRLLAAAASSDDALLSDESLRLLANEGAVEAVVRGSYARLGEILRIAYTIDDAKNGAVLRSESLDGVGDDSLFELVDRLSTSVIDSFAATRPDLSPPTIQAATTASLPAWQAYSQAQTLYLEKSDPEGAIAKLEEAIRLDSEFALAHVNLARMHQSLGRTATAQTYSQKAVELAEHLPLNEQLNAEGGYYGSRWSTLGRAIETYGLALKIYPHSPTWRNNLARRYAFLERYREAIEEFEKLIDAGVEFWGNFYGAANAYAALGDFDTGYRLLSEFARENSDNWLIHYSLAWHLTEWGKLEEADKIFQRVIELRPDGFHRHYGQWRLAALGEQWQRADLHARQLLTFEDAFARWRGHVSLARNALYAGRSTAALAALDAAIEAASDADRALARCFKAELLLARGEPLAALQEAEQAIVEGSEQWPELRGHFVAALAQQALGREAEVDASTESLRERWRRQPNAVEERQLHHLTGLLALARGDGEASAAALERAAALLPARGVEFSWHVFPDHVPIWTALGEAELAAGRPRAAVAWLIRATASGAEHLEQPLAYVRAFYLKGLAHNQLAETQEAREALASFLASWHAGDFSRQELRRARSLLQ